MGFDPLKGVPPQAILNTAKDLNLLGGEELGRVQIKLKALDRDIEVTQNQIEQAKGKINGLQAAKLIIMRPYIEAIHEVRNRVARELQERGSLPSSEEIDAIVQERSKPLDISSLSGLKAKELKNLCKRRGLDAEGRKQELIDRLLGHDDKGTPPIG